MNSAKIAGLTSMPCLPAMSSKKYPKSKSVWQSSSSMNPIQKSHKYEVILRIRPGLS